MPRIKRTDAIQLMEFLGFSTAGALSTHRLEKKINRVDRIAIDERKKQEHNLLKFVLASLDAQERIIVEEDRPSIERPQHQEKIQRNTRPVPKFDRSIRESKYDWDKILCGKVLVLEKGVDYDCKSTNFAMQVRSAAKRRKQQVRIATKENEVVVQATGEISPQNSPD